MKNKTIKIQVEKYKREDDPELNNSQELIDYLVDAYKQTGSLKYRDCLLECFEGYFVKYVSILSHHNHGVNVNNKDTKNFLRLFMSKEERSSQHTYEKNAGAIVHKIRRACRCFTPGDIYNEIVVHFLELLENYKPISFKRSEKVHRISFAHYLQVNMRYRLCNSVIKKCKEPLTGRETVEYHEYLHDDIDNCDYEDPDDAINIDLDGWVWGDTSGGIFSGLTKAERYLLWMKYEGDPEGEVNMRALSSMMGVHYQTIVYRLDKIRNKLRVAMKGVV